jgi:hypothetical protein
MSIQLHLRECNGCSNNKTASVRQFLTHFIIVYILLFILIDNPLQLFRKYVIMIPDETTEDPTTTTIVHTTIVFKHDEVPPDDPNESITPDPTVDQG